MKLPKTFIPKKNLDEKIEQALRAKKIRKKSVLETKRHIHITFTNNLVLESNIIHVCITSAMDYVKWQKNYNLEIESLEEFCFPLSDNFREGGERIRTYGNAFLANEENLIFFFEHLRKNNEGVLIWSSKGWIPNLKESFDKKYPHLSDYSILDSKYESAHLFRTK